MDIKPLTGRQAWASASVFLIVVNVAVALAMGVFGAGWSHSDSSVQMAWGANFGPATKDGEWWRLGTAMFLHFGLLHLLANMLALWDSGRLVESIFGTRRFLVIYLVGGLTGNLLSLIVQGDTAISGGASGAIFGVYGAFLVFLLHHRRQLHPVDFKWMFGGAAIFSLALLALGWFIPAIDNAAHAGGLVAGGVTGFILLPGHSSGSAVHARARLFAGMVFLLVVITLLAQIPAPRYRWSDEAIARDEIRAFAEEDARVNARLRALLRGSNAAGATFDELAGQIEADVVRHYEQSFEQLSDLHLSPQVPSAATVERLRQYAEKRREASQALAEGLRTHNELQVKEALRSSGRAAKSLN